MRNIAKFLQPILLSLFLAAPVAKASPDEPLALRNNGMAFDLYAKLRGEEGDIFVSPYSVSSAMNMVYEGAKGETADELARALHISPSAPDRHSSWSESVRRLNAKTDAYALSTANALWAQEQYRFLPEYFDVVQKYYGGTVTNLDFVHAAEQARLTINHWVEERTNSKIKDLIPGGAITGLTRLIITNAVYFKGKWDAEFDSKLTKEEPFTTGSGEQVKVQMMSKMGEEAKFRYVELNGTQAVELPYKGGTLSMLVFLPMDKNLPALEQRLTNEEFRKITAGLSEQQIELYLPRFKVEAKYSLKPQLMAMGCKLAFDPDNADFTGMTGKRDLYVSQVIHQSFIEVNEEGTEAAAATAVLMLAGSAFHEPRPIPVFRADHPFLFFIIERSSEGILFMGRKS